jgi:fumarate hydratase subunit beta
MGNFQEAFMLKKVHLPLTDESVKELHAGDNVLLNGVIYVARDAAHKRLVETLDKGQPLPFDIKGQTIYYMGLLRPNRVR